MKYKKSIVVTDAKSEIYRITDDLFRKNNYTVKVFNLKDMIHSDRWNRATCCNLKRIAQVI